jgi:hypothetical protein
MEGLRKHLLDEHGDVFTANDGVGVTPENTLNVMVESLTTLGADDRERFAAMGRIHAAIHATEPARAARDSHAAEVARRREV